MKKNLIVAFFVLAGVVCLGVVAKADTFNNNLYYGIRENTDVSQLQEFLTTQGLYSGPISGNFFSLTLAAVEQFQTSQNITPAAGYFGPVTRTKMNALIDQQVQASNNQAITETSSTPLTPTPTTTSNSGNSLQAQLNALIQELALLEGQAQTQQSTSAPAISQPTVTQPLITNAWSTYQSVAFGIFQANPNAYLNQNVMLNGLFDGTFLPSNNGTPNYIEIQDPSLVSPPVEIAITSQSNYTLVVNALSGKYEPIIKVYGTGTTMQNFTMTNGTSKMIPVVTAQRIDICNDAAPTCSLGTTSIFPTGLNTPSTINQPTPPPQTQITIPPVPTQTSTPPATTTITSVCTPNWHCNNWNACGNSQQTRICSDINNCGTATGKPGLTQSCLMPTPTSTATNTYTITVSAGSGCTISPSGVIKVVAGGSQTFTTTANSGYQWTELLVDGNGENLTGTNSYTFSQVTSNHSITSKCYPTSFTPFVSYYPNSGIFLNEPGDETELTGLNFEASNFTGSTLTHLTITFSGPAASIPGFLDAIQLFFIPQSASVNVDGDVTAYGATVTTSSICNSSNPTCTVTWTFPTAATLPQYVQGGSIATFVLGISSQFVEQNPQLVVNASIQNANDVGYINSSGSGASTVSGVTTPNIFPLTILTNYQL